MARPSLAAAAVVAAAVGGAGAAPPEPAAAGSGTNPLSAALRDALRTEVALSASARVLVLTEAAGFLPLIHAAASARVPETQVGGKSGNGGKNNNNNSSSPSSFDVAAAAAGAKRDGACVLVDREALCPTTTVETAAEEERRRKRRERQRRLLWSLLFARGRFTCDVDFALLAGYGSAAASQAAFAAAPA